MCWYMGWLLFLPYIHCVVWISYPLCNTQVLVQSQSTRPNCTEISLYCSKGIICTKCLPLYCNMSSLFFWTLYCNMSSFVFLGKSTTTCNDNFRYDNFWTNLLQFRTTLTVILTTTMGECKVMSSYIITYNYGWLVAPASPPCIRMSPSWSGW